MMKTLITASALTIAVSSFAFAGQPERPGAFGRDRAAGVHSFQKGGANDTGAAGASEWGKIAGDRGKLNGSMNQDYKASHGGSPTKGAPTR